MSECDWTLRTVEPSRITRVGLRVIPPEPVPESQRDELMAAVESRTAHNSLRRPPDITIELSTPDIGERPALTTADAGKG